MKFLGKKKGGKQRSRSFKLASFSTFRMGFRGIESLTGMKFWQRPECVQVAHSERTNKKSKELALFLRGGGVEDVPCNCGPAGIAASDLSLLCSAAQLCQEWTISIGGAHQQTSERVEPPVSVEEKGKTTGDKKENCYYF
jgi:hypothetical protein